MNRPIGLYIHIPFCKAKCSYCDFYSFCSSKDEIKNYIRSLAQTFSGLKNCYASYSFSSVYIGGGTPSLLGEDIVPLMDAVRENFNIKSTAEITAEANPESAKDFLPAAKSAGINRLSFGIQSSRDNALKSLGRLHTADKAKGAVLLAKKLGFQNISGDLMIALPKQTRDELEKDIDFLLSLPLNHISAYILKAEKGTPLYTSGVSLPDDDTTADYYLYTCRRLEDAGYIHYEISNFAKPGFEGRHNLNYWLCGEYLGIGPAAHSFVGNKRFFYQKDYRAFVLGAPPVYEAEGGDISEKFMLGLRLSRGVKIADYPFLEKEKAQKKIERFEKEGLVKVANGNLSLTDNGFLLSNSIITELSYENL